MHIIFIDESGTPPKQDKDRPRYFVLGGAIIHEAAWHRIRDALLGLKAQYKIRGELKWRYFAQANTDERNPMRRLLSDERDKIRHQMYEIMKNTGVTTIAAICSAKAAYAMPSTTTMDDIYHLTYKALSERFQYYLQDLGKTETGWAYGVMVADHRGAADDLRLRRHHEMLVHSGAEFTSNYNNIIESVFMQPSNLSVGVQLADMVAGAVWRKFEKNDSKWFDIMEPTLRRSKHGGTAGFGIVKVPTAGWV